MPKGVVNFPDPRGLVTKNINQTIGQPMTVGQWLQWLFQREKEREREREREKREVEEKKELDGGLWAWEHVLIQIKMLRLNEFNRKKEHLKRNIALWCLWS